MSAELAELLEAAEAALHFIHRFVDVEDGDYGQMEPNEAMTLAKRLRDAIVMADKANG